MEAVQAGAGNGDQDEMVGALILSRAVTQGTPALPREILTSRAALDATVACDSIESSRRR